MKSKFQSYRLSQLIVKFILTKFFLLNFIATLFAQVNPPYPRTGIFHWGGAPSEWYAKFGLIITSSTSSSFAADIKKINPDAIVLATRDINAGQAVETFYDEWYARDSKGEKTEIYSGNYYLPDITDYCPKVNGKRYNEAVAEYLSSFVDLNFFGGVATDGFWESISWRKSYGGDNIDLDRNGVNDFDEHGDSWIDNQWAAGAGKIIKGIDDRIGSDKVFVINGGTHSDYWDYFNGVVFEYGGGFASNWYYAYSRYQDLVANLQASHACYIDGCGVWGGISENDNVRNDFQLMRFILSTTLMGDGYFGFQVKLKDHYVLAYYDEFDVDLGYPTSSPHETMCADGACVFVRFFDKGVVIFNASGKSITISDNDLKSLNGYKGPYYRFQGGQDPKWNNGEKYNSAVLNGWSSGKNFMGDALILLNQPTVMVSDIVVDNIDETTSPGSDPVELVGDWVHDSADDSWSQGNRHWYGFYDCAYVPGGSGESYAIYKPSIGVTGNYEVYEWHGNYNGNQASNVPYEIHHANGITSGKINQSQNIGKWNYLGTFSLSNGNTQYVKISNNANGYVIADAIKFVHKTSQDSIPPNSPSNLKSLIQTENSIALSWTPPSPASDGDLASGYLVYRDNSLVGNSTVSNFTDKGLQENTSYFYAVYALDDVGNKSSSATTGNFSTTSDISPPTVTSVRTLSPTLVEIIFSENIDRANAEDINNYSIDKNINIYSATLVNNLDSVNLVTSTHTAGELYTLTINNIKDRALIPNTIALNTKSSYIGGGQQINISISADDQYEVYFNGNLIGSDENWNIAETYSPTLIGGKNVIAVKAINTGGVGGLITEIDFDNYHLVSDESWKISTTYYSEWEKNFFDDLSWNKATAYGSHGSTEPWTSFGDVQGISKTSGVKWIWSSDSMNDDIVYFRISFNVMDMTAPNQPQGVRLSNQ